MCQDWIPNKRSLIDHYVMLRKQCLGCDKNSKLLEMPEMTAKEVLHRDWNMLAVKLEEKNHLNSLTLKL